MSSPPSPLIIAHRGSSAVAPENTLAAFAQAFADGADGIELDVRLARDGVPVVIHDGNLRHVAGRNEAVENLTSAQVREVDVGSWFNRRRRRLAKLEYGRQTIPLLEDVFRFLSNQTSPNFVAYVELKTTRNPSLNAELVAAVVELIRRHRMRARTVVISFNLAVVAQAKKLDSSIRTGALFGPRQKGLRPVARVVDAAIDCGAQEILLHRLIAKPAMVSDARGLGLKPVVWTVDDPKWLGRATRQGMHALMTNNPAMMIEQRSLARPHLVDLNLRGP
jgi:glycerophosphoryl diester phosphodiesterase